MKFAIELVFFNDLESIKRSIKSYIEFVDKVIAIDGRHTTFKKYNELSKDGSREYLKSFDKVMLIDLSDYEIVKREKAKNICKDIEIENLIIIDSDEYLTGNWNDFIENYKYMKELDKTNLDLYKLKIQRLDDPEMFYYHPLLFYKPWNFVYYNGKHNIPIKRSNINENNYIFAPQSFDYPVEGIQIMHDHNLRTKIRNKVRIDNLKWQKDNDK